MNLALISNHNGAAGQQAIEHIIDDKHQAVGYVSSEHDAERAYFHYTQCVYQRSNISVTHYVDFEDDYDDKLLQQLFDYSVIHLSGGNTFRFLKGLQQHHAMSAFIQWVKNGGTLIGLSAGALLMTPDINIAGLCGDPNDVNLENTLGFNLVPFGFLPHVENDPARQQQLASQLASVDFPVVLASDDDAVVIKNGELTLVGQPTVAWKGKVIADPSAVHQLLSAACIS